MTPVLSWVSNEKRPGCTNIWVFRAAVKTDWARLQQPTLTRVKCGLSVNRPELGRFEVSHVKDNWTEIKCRIEDRNMTSLPSRAASGAGTVSPPCFSICALYDPLALCWLRSSRRSDAASFRSASLRAQPRAQSSRCGVVATVQRLCLRLLLGRTAHRPPM